MNHINIWQPKYSTKEVLIKSFNIHNGINQIDFTKCDHPSLQMDGMKIKSYKMIGHGKRGVYAVPIKDFDTVTLTDQLSLI